MAGHRIKVVLKNLKELRMLPDQVDELLAIRRAIHHTLPTQLAGQFSVGRLTNGTLTIHANNGSSAAKIKHITPGLIALLRSKGHQINAILVRAQAHTESNTLCQKDILMTPTAQDAVSALADRLGDSPLKSALSNLAKRSTDPAK